MITLIFGILASERGKRLKRPGLTGLVEQAATVLSLLAKNVGVVHQSFHICIDGQLCCKNIWSNKPGQKPHFGSILYLLFPKFGRNLFINGTSCHSLYLLAKNTGAVNLSF